MNKIVRVLIVLVFLISIVMNFDVNAKEEGNNNNTTPPEMLDKKFRIGFAETDPYFNFAGTFHGIIQGLESIKWVGNIEELPYVSGQDDSKEMWNWLADHNVSPYIEFVKDAHYSFIEPNAGDMLKNRLENSNDLDLVIVMGTDAGKQIATYNQSTPVLVFSSSSAVEAGIIQSVEDSGKDHMWAHVDSTRYQRQLEVFHDLFQFKKLGVIYENSDVGKIYAAIEDLHLISSQKGRTFEVIEYHVNEPSTDPADQVRYHNEVASAIKKLAKEVDAFYLTSNKIDKPKIVKLIQPFYEEGIPVFSQSGSSEVEYGALLSLYRANYNGIGRFGAETIVNILNGQKPRNLSQVYGDTPSIVLNLQAAKNIGYNPPFEILLVADEIFQSIKSE